MFRLIRALFDGFFLHCPRCHSGGMFARGFTMNERCSTCGLPFESASGEMTGGMGINISVTLILVIGAAMYYGLQPTVPLIPLLLGLGAFAIIFPIAFQRSARGLWVSILYLTGNITEGD